MYLFFDTETTGLPISWKAPVYDTQNWPRMVQIAWLLFDDKGALIEKNDFIIKPKGFFIPADAEGIHGISTGRALKEGEDLSTVLVQFAHLIDKANTIVAHNISFDEKIVGAEFVRKNISHQLFKKRRFCTMKESAEFCKIPGKFGYKWPNLAALHRKVFATDFTEAHNAAIDVQITAKCFWKLRDMNIF